jgi:hypothetical protein
LRQVHDVIEERQAERRRLDLAWRGAEVRMICQFVAAASGSAQLLTAAGAVTLLPEDPDEQEAAAEPRMLTAEQARSMFGGAP